MMNFWQQRWRTPAILQMEAAECGAAALGIILAHYHCYQPLEKLRVECGVSRDGSKAVNIIKAARRYGMEAYGVQIEEIGSLTSIQWPCILHWQLNHFVVLERIVGEKIFINDPAQGRRTITRKELDYAFSGIALILKKTDQFQQGQLPPSVLSGLKRRLQGCWGALAFVAIVSLALILPGILIPGFIKIFIDDILIHQRDHWLPMLSSFMIVVLFFQAAFVLLQKKYLLRWQTHLSLKTSANFFWHVLQLPYNFFQQRFSGDINERVSANSRISQLVSGEFTASLIGMISMLFYAIVMFFIDWQLTLVGIIVVVINFYLLLVISHKIANVSRSFLQTRGNMQGLEMNSLQNIETLKATASESQFFQQWAGYHAKVLNAQQAIMVYNQALLIVPGLLFGLLTVAILGFGSWKIIQGQLTVGTLVAFQTLMTNFSAPTSTLLGLGNQIQQARGDMARLDDVLENPRDLCIEQALDLPYNNIALTGALELRNVSFGYSPLEKPLLEHLNLRVSPGQHIALVGRTGSGKSSLIKLLTGLYQPWHGSVLFDGQSIGDLSRQSFSRDVALVDQDIFLFSGTIADNLTLWGLQASEDELLQSLRQACLYDEIISRGGLYAQVEEGGSNFSGGQCQRLEIARALVKHPKVLLLDEATSALDPVLEEKIYQNLKQLGITLIIIAHRLSAIRDCDQIIVFDDGKIIEQGNHETLIKANSAYAKLVRLD